MSLVTINLRRKIPRGWEHAPDLGDRPPSHYMCPQCLTIGDTDDFDCMGLPKDIRQCTACGELVVPAGVAREAELPLFRGMT